MFQLTLIECIIVPDGERGSPAKHKLVLDKNRAYRGRKKPNRNGVGQIKTASVLSGIHNRDSSGMVQMNPSDAFSVLLTFSSSPRRRVVCQTEFTKLDLRENNVKTQGLSVETCRPVITARVLWLLSTWLAAHGLHSSPRRDEEGENTRRIVPMYGVIVKSPDPYSIYQSVAFDGE